MCVRMTIGCTIASKAKINVFEIFSSLRRPLLYIKKTRWLFGFWGKQCGSSPNCTFLRSLGHFSNQPTYMYKNNFFIRRTKQSGRFQIHCFKMEEKTHWRNWNIWTPTSQTNCLWNFVRSWCQYTKSTIGCIRKWGIGIYLHIHGHLSWS